MCGVCTSTKTPEAGRGTQSPDHRRVHGSWGSWTSFTRCSVTCGGGQQNRTRVCNNPSPSNGGRKCDGSATENRKCNNHACNTQPKPTKTTKGALPACSKRDHNSCSDYKKYKRRYCGKGWVRRNCAEMCGVCTSTNTPAPSRRTPVVGQRTVHGSWGSWTSFTRCSVTCG